MSDTVCVVVAGGHPLYRQAVARVISEHPDLDLVGEAADAASAIEQVRALRPEVAVVDLKTLGTGDKAVEEIAAEGATRVLIISPDAESEDVLSAVSRGANGYVTKDADADAICQALLKVAAGEPALSPEAEAALFSGVQSPREESEPLLTEREVEVLQLAAEGSSNPEIGRSLYLSTETVKSHLHHAYQKLDVSDRTAAVAQAFRRGLIK